MSCVEINMLEFEILRHICFMPVYSIAAAIIMTPATITTLVENTTNVVFWAFSLFKKQGLAY